MILNGVYKITNITNNIIYIGSTSGKYGFTHRFNCHKNDLKNNRHGNSYLQNAWNKYGESSFKFEIIEIIEDKSKIIEREQYYLDLYKVYLRENGYNICKIAGSSYGIKRSAECKAKISKNNKSMSPEVRKKISDSLTGKKQSEETIKKRSLKLIGRVSGMKNKNHSPETKLKMSLIHKNNDFGGRFKKGNKSHNQKEILQSDLNGNVIKIWNSLTEINKILKLNRVKISIACKSNDNILYGYKWTYNN